MTLVSYDNNDPLRFLSKSHKIFDAHTHVWSESDVPRLVEWSERFGVQKILGIAEPEVRSFMERENPDLFVFALDLSSENFAHYKIDKILEEVEEAHSLGYSSVKTWFGPRFLDFTQAKSQFRMNNPKLDQVYALIEDLGLVLDIHVADPDLWFTREYSDSTRYGTKEQALADFEEVIGNYSRMKVVGVHFGGQPERLLELTRWFSSYTNFWVDTASTRWIIRELGRTPGKSRDFLIKHSNRVLFATDLSTGFFESPKDEYFPTRLWSQRLFWETSFSAPLPFDDPDNSEQTIIRGLSLPSDTLKNLYWNNASNIFS